MIKYPTSKMLVVSSAILLLVLFSGCNMPTKSIATEESSGMIHTVAAQTVAAQMTKAASDAQDAGVQDPVGDQQPPQDEQGQAPAQPSATPTPTPTATQIPPTITPNPTATNTPIPCDHIDFGDPVDVTIPDGTDMDPGESFTKIWRLKNGGSCTWTSGYDLVFVSGDNMGAPAAVQITSGTVPPGAEMDVAVDLVAPNNPGVYRG